MEIRAGQAVCHYISAIHRDCDQSSPSSARIIPRRPSYVSIAGRQPTDSSLLVSTTKSPLKRTQTSLRPHMINKRRTMTCGTDMVDDERPCILRNIVKISPLVIALEYATR